MTDRNSLADAIDPRKGNLRAITDEYCDEIGAYEVEAPDLIAASDALRMPVPDHYGDGFAALITAAEAVEGALAHNHSGVNVNPWLAGKINDLIRALVKVERLTPTSHGDDHG